MKSNQVPGSEAPSTPISSLPWRWIDDHLLSTPLGDDLCRVEVLDMAGHDALKPGEDARVRKLQARAFCEWVIQTEGVILGGQLKYLLKVFHLSQAKLAAATRLTPGAVSQLVHEKLNPSPQTSRELALLFRLECSCTGFVAALAENRFEDPSRQAA